MTASASSWQSYHAPTLGSRVLGRCTAGPSNAKAVGEAQELAKLVGAVTVTISRKAGENDQLFGSVTAADIADSLTALKYNVERRKIHLDEPIRTLGEHKVAVRLHRDVIAEITVNVTREE